MVLLGISLALFLGIALGGALMAVMTGQGKPVPVMLPRLHGVGALIALGVLIYAALQGHGGNLAWFAATTFLVGALGGLSLFGYLFRGKAKPMYLILGHGGIGILGLVLLVAALMQ